MAKALFSKSTFVAACLLAAAQPVAAEIAPADIVKTYAGIAEAVFGDAAARAKALDAAIDALLAAPSPQTLDAARAAWKAARIPYMQTEGYRFGNKIVDDWEGKVNAWPLDEGLIDYVDPGFYGDSSDENELYTANVIANPKIKLGDVPLNASKIDKALLRKIDKALDVETNVAGGYHAIEFLLWGQDLNGTGPGAGNRPATDYDLKACTGGNCDRRRAYLKVASQLLIDDLNEMVGNWKVGGKARQHLAAQDQAGQLTVILTGIGSLSYGELAGERMKLGVILHDTEEEHDCFSDNTQNSHYYDQVGIMNIWNGKYDGDTPVSGPSIAAYAREKAPEAAKRADDAMALTLEKMSALKAKADSGEMAYDQMLAAGNDVGNKLILDAVDALIAQARAIEAVVAALNLKIELQGSDSLDRPEAVGGAAKP
ncbi:MAG: peptidase [Hyphomicrobium sp.]|nr:peptidase [Hyphomicrobium sp.]